MHLDQGHATISDWRLLERRGDHERRGGRERGSGAAGAVQRVHLVMRPGLCDAIETYLWLETYLWVAGGLVEDEAIATEAS